MEQVFKGAYSKRYVSFIVIIPIVAVAFILGVLFIGKVPLLMKILGLGVISMFVIVFSIAMLINFTCFRIYVNEDKSILVMRNGIPFLSKKSPANTLYMGYGKISCLITKDNIKGVGKPSPEDIKVIDKYSPENVATVNPARKIKYTIDTIQAISKEGVYALYSFMFLSDRSRVAKIMLKDLTVKTLFWEKKLGSSVLYVSIKDVDRFLSLVR